MHILKDADKLMKIIQIITELSGFTERIIFKKITYFLTIDSFNPKVIGVTSRGLHVFHMGVLCQHQLSQNNSFSHTI